MLCAVLARGHLEDVGYAQQGLQSVPVRHHLQTNSLVSNSQVKLVFISVTCNHSFTALRVASRVGKPQTTVGLFWNSYKSAPCWRRLINKSGGPRTQTGCCYSHSEERKCHRTQTTVHSAWSTLNNARVLRVKLNRIIISVIMFHRAFTIITQNLQAEVSAVSLVLNQQVNNRISAIHFVVLAFSSYSTCFRGHCDCGSTFRMQQRGKQRGAGANLGEPRSCSSGIRNK